MGTSLLPRSRNQARSHLYARNLRHRSWRKLPSASWRRQMERPSITALPICQGGAAFRILAFSCHSDFCIDQRPGGRNFLSYTLRYGVQWSWFMDKYDGPEAFAAKADRIPGDLGWD